MKKGLSFLPRLIKGKSFLKEAMIYSFAIMAIIAYTNKSFAEVMDDKSICYQSMEEKNKNINHWQGKLNQCIQNIMIENATSGNNIAQEVYKKRITGKNANISQKLINANCFVPQAMLEDFSNTPLCSDISISNKTSN